MSPPIMVVPHGTGIGDFVNLRPLVAAVVQRFPDRRVTVLGPPTHAWLLPEGAELVQRLFGLRTWTRPHEHHVVSRLLSIASVRQIGPMRHVLPRVSAARVLTRLVGARGFQPINLLETFALLDLDRRWTPGPWSGERQHVIDELARALEDRGIPVAPSARTPTLHVNPLLIPGQARVVLSPGAGSSLKEAPPAFWRELARRLVQRGLATAVLRSPGQPNPPGHDVPGAVVFGHRDLRVVAGMLASAGVVISPDSGILHLAAALGTPWVGLFGSTDPEFLGPYRRVGGVTVETSAEHSPPCQGCWVAQMLPCARCALYAPSTCLSHIEVEVVERTVLKMLRAGDAAAQRGFHGLG